MRCEKCGEAHPTRSNEAASVRNACRCERGKPCSARRRGCGLAVQVVLPEGSELLCQGCCYPELLDEEPAQAPPSAPAPVAEPVPRAPPPAPRKPKPPPAVTPVNPVEEAAPIDLPLAAKECLDGDDQLVVCTTCDRKRKFRDSRIVPVEGGMRFTCQCGGESYIQLDVPTKPRRRRART